MTKTYGNSSRLRASAGMLDAPHDSIDSTMKYNALRNLSTSARCCLRSSYVLPRNTRTGSDAAGGLAQRGVGGGQLGELVMRVQAAGVGQPPHPCGPPWLLWPDHGRRRRERRAVSGDADDGEP